MFSYFVQGESVYAVALHICSLWHDKRRVARAEGGKYLWKGERGRQTAANWQLLMLLVQKKTALQLKKSSWQCCKLLWLLPLPPLPLLLLLLQAVAIVPGYGSAIALLKILMLQSLLGEWEGEIREGEREAWLPCICSLRHTHASTRRSRRRSSSIASSRLQLPLLRCCQLWPFPVSNTSEASVAVFAGSLLRLAGITFSCLGFVSIRQARYLPLSLSLFLLSPSYWQLPRPPVPLLTRLPVLCKCISMLLLSLSLKSINISYWKVKWRIFVFLRENNSLFFLEFLLLFFLFFQCSAGGEGVYCVCVLCILNVLIKNTNLYIKFVRFYCQTWRVQQFEKTTHKLAFFRRKNKTKNHKTKNNHKSDRAIGMYICTY